MNTAKRVYAIVEAATRYPSGADPTGKAWAVAMGLVDRQSDASEDETTLGLQAFRSELEALEAQLVAAGIRQDLYADQLSRLRTVSSPTQIRSQWGQIVGNINTPDVHLVLKWAGVHLPDREPEFGEEKLDDLTKAFHEVAAAVEAADLPPAINAYVNKQLKTIRAALRMYRIRGLPAIDEALESAYGAARKAQEPIAAEARAHPDARKAVERVNGVIVQAMHLRDSIESLRDGGLIEMATGIENLLSGPDAAPVS